MGRESGYSLVEIMVVTAIIAILAGVAVPAYVNYRNRAIQTEAVEALLRAKMEQEIFWAENNRYAGTIGCLPSFGNSCSRASFLTPNSYTVSVSAANANSFRVRAQKTVFAGVSADTLAITETLEKPAIANEDALKFSIFKLIFD
jgi:type IV pilus assembly protein PilE